MNRAIIGAFVVVVGLFSPLRAQELLPLRAGVTHIKGNVVEGVVINHTSLAATAWSVEFITTTADGSETQSRTTHDNYITTAHRDLEPHRIPKVVPAGGMYAFSTTIGDADGAQARTIVVRVVAAIFEDGSALGDEEIIHHRFLSRQADRDTYAALLNALRGAIADGGRREDALALTAHLTKNHGLYPAPGIVEGLLQNLRAISMSQTSNPQTALPLLERMFVADYAAAVKHSIRTK